MFQTLDSIRCAASFGRLPEFDESHHLLYSRQSSSPGAMAQLIGPHLKDLHESSKIEATNIRNKLLYWSRARSSSEEPEIPDPKLFQTLELLPDADVTTLPKASECAVHLELLEVFYT